MDTLLIAENIRSSYNVGSMMRTADGLGRHVWCSGFSPTPERDPSVAKTALGAENTVWLSAFWNTTHALDAAQDRGLLLVALEITPTSRDIRTLDETQLRGYTGIALCCGNENTGVLPATLARCPVHVHIPMAGIKESLNVCQAAAIAMREINHVLAHKEKKKPQ